MKTLFPLLFLLLLGCGQSGDLYIPDNQPEQTDESVTKDY
ncbi:MAG: LPS translocon maturation chaperone LptM [Oceanococcus sp.]